MSVEMKIKRKVGCDDLPLPRYMSEGASGMDLYAAVETDTELLPGEIKLIPTGLFISLPQGWEAQVRPRSGLALKHSLTVVNSPGTIDSDYRGEIGIILGNVGQNPYVVKRGDRIAQMVVQQVFRAEITVVEELDETVRSGGGFGHTGVK